MTISQQIENLLFQSAASGDTMVVFTFSRSEISKIEKEIGKFGVRHYTIPRKVFVKQVLEAKPK